MAYVTLAEARAAARRAQGPLRQKTEATLLREARDTSSNSFDIFLSHSVMDRELVLGAKQLLNEKGFTVYVDWIDDPLMDRQAVTRTSADQIRTRMRQCRSLFYLHTSNAAKSKWCPWELGYFDAFTHPSRRVFIFPLTADGQTYSTQEYLSLYETVDFAMVGIVNRERANVRLKKATGEVVALSI